MLSCLFCEHLAIRMHPLFSERLSKIQLGIPVFTEPFGIKRVIRDYLVTLIVSDQMKQGNYLISKLLSVIKHI